MKKYDSQASGGQIALISSKRYGTLAGRVSAWFDQRSRMSLIQQAQEETDADVASLTAKHAEIEKQAADASASASAQPDAATSDVRSRVARMDQAHAFAQMHNIVEDQLDTQKQLSTVYAKWHAQVKLQHSIVTHLALQSLSWIAFFILCGVSSPTRPALSSIASPPTAAASTLFAPSPFSAFNS